MIWHGYIARCQLAYCSCSYRFRNLPSISLWKLRSELIIIRFHGTRNRVPLVLTIGNTISENEGTRTSLPRLTIRLTKIERSYTVFVRNLTVWPIDASISYPIHPFQLHNDTNAHYPAPLISYHFVQSCWSVSPTTRYFYVMCTFAGPFGLSPTMQLCDDEHGSILSSPTSREIEFLGTSGHFRGWTCWAGDSESYGTRIISVPMQCRPRQGRPDLLANPRLSTARFLHIWPRNIHAP
jgi:hypothetical protein